MKPIHIVLITGVLITMFLIASCTEKVEETAPIIRPVRYQQVFATGGTRVRTFSGTAQAGMESKLSFKVHGTVKKLQ